MLLQDVCLFVLSVCHSDSHTILVFLHQTLWQYSDGDPLTGRESRGEYEKSRFSTNILLYLRHDTR